MSPLEKNSTTVFHKIRKNESIKAANALTEAFIDYPQLKRMYACRNQKRYRRKVLATMLFWIYTLSDSFYTNDGVNCVVCLEKPTDRNPGMLGLLPHPRFLIRCLLCDFSVPDFFNMSNYLRFTDFYANKHIKKGDSYLHLICTVGEARHSGLFSRFFSEQDDGMPLFLETHNEENVNLYRHMGLDVLEQAEWKGVPHYLMRRPNGSVSHSQNGFDSINQ